MNLDLLCGEIFFDYLIIVEVIEVFQKSSNSLSGKLCMLILSDSTGGNQLIMFSSD